MLCCLAIIIILLTILIIGSLYSVGSVGPYQELTLKFGRQNGDTKQLTKTILQLLFQTSVLGIQ